ncbi:hypothetical protein PVK06_002580 [Gossypium arboreum]|uniref:Sec23/Sec24 trunk domain-containing protein n=1 Tax=Gossypium arboreum TaxID=29729 RepID=A0ABR0R3Z5_GOSAR|nr:hypothetical protein PVK06_002580 [Gossypium arboreum]
MGEIKDNDAYQEELLDYEEEDEKAPDSASIKAADSAKNSGFRDFLLKPELLHSIVDSGFEHPSEGKLATSDYIVRDTGNCTPRYMRCTTNQVITRLWILGKVVLFDVPIAKCRQNLEPLLENIPTMFQSSTTAESCFGAAIKVHWNLVLMRV